LAFKVCNILSIYRWTWTLEYSLYWIGVVVSVSLKCLFPVYCRDFFWIFAKSKHVSAKWFECSSWWLWKWFVNFWILLCCQFAMGYLRNSVGKCTPIDAKNWSRSGNIQDWNWTRTDLYLYKTRSLFVCLSEIASLENR